MGKLIVLEACDGAGKSTQLELIKNYIKEKGLSFSFFHFPMYGHNEFSDMIAKYLRGEYGNIDEVSPYFVAFIYAMDRSKFLPELQKELDEKDIVLLDRYVYSNIAYQGAKLGEEIEDWIYDFEFNFLKLPYPDLNLFFDVPIKILEQRLKQDEVRSDREYLQGKQDIHEADLSFQEKVRNEFIAVSKNKNFKIIKTVFSSGTMMNPSVIILSPYGLFQSYKKYIDKIIKKL